jgi:motility quorum-sensing regulator/GCU-specific mRNA interferase toxin
MVNETNQRRDFPAHDLGRIVELAKAGKVTYLNDSVFRDTENYGYSPSDVHICLAMLLPADFRHSVLYEGNKAWLDVYKIAVISPGAGFRDDLYVKLKVNPSCILVLLCSFHPDR